MISTTLDGHSVVPAQSRAALRSVERISDPSNTAATPQFVWGAGIECSFIPHLDVDQFEWTQHQRFWKDDFRRAKEELGLSALRYSLPWHKIEPQRGHYDWQPWDERIEAAHDMGLELYLDVMHFGTPLWLRQAAGDPEFPESLERFAAALVNRYRTVVTKWCPCNEPLVLSLFSGDFGFWPPHSRKWRGYMPVLSRVVQAASRAIRAIRQADPQANVIWCDNVENYRSRVPELADEVRRRNLRPYLALDLLLGRVDQRHPLYAWITDYGLSEIDLEWFRTHPQSPDTLGLDYYPNSEWQLDGTAQAITQRRSETPMGLYGLAKAYYNRYGLPMMVTETSADGHPINRQIWLDQTIEDCKRLREAGIPMNGYFWWPMIDQIDWDGALTHRVGKIHDVGIYNLKRMPDGTLSRHPTPLVDQFATVVAGGERYIGKLESIVLPSNEEDHGNQIAVETSRNTAPAQVKSAEVNIPAPSNVMVSLKDAGESPGIASAAAAGAAHDAVIEVKLADRHGIVVFSHLRWGFVWQRPQQFLSRFARKHKVLFVEEPFFDLPAGAPSRLDFHTVMPNVTVICPHLDPSWNRNPGLPALLRKFTQEGIEALNEQGDFDKPLLWYYSPMDSAWSLGHFENRGVVYDCMDELSQFSGAPKSLVQNEARLMSAADVVFAGGYELGEKKQQQHDNVHAFGCGVDFSHFARAGDPATAVPPDIDFMTRPILGWFGVVDERVDYAMVGAMAKLRPQWSFAMVGPVVKIDPNLLPHSPNLFWLGSRDYQQLPNYCRAFDVSMMPFAMNSSTQFINPTKALEYMATGRPIISTPVRDVVRQWSHVVRVAKSAEEFIAAAEEAMRAGPSDERIARGIELAQRSSWESTVETMQGLIRHAIGAPSRRSSRPIEPLTESQLEYAYASTGGS